MTDKKIIVRGLEILGGARDGEVVYGSDIPITNPILEPPEEKSENKGIRIKLKYEFLKINSRDARYE